MTAGNRTSRRTAGIAVAAVGLLAGLGQAVLWSRIAPQQRWVAYPDSDPLSLPTESVHRFTAIGMFALISLVVGIVLAVAAWQIRFARGWPLLAAAGAGTAAGSALALWLGPIMAGGTLPVNVHPVGQPVMVAMPPSISWTLVAVAPMALLLTYTFLAAWHPDPGLGRPQAVTGQAAGSGTSIDRPGHDELGMLTTAPIPIVPAASDPAGGQLPR